jgi:hypothetical protein
MENSGASISAVIAGLDPAIHPFRKNSDAKKMDPRVKPAGDAPGWASTGSIRPGHELAAFLLSGNAPLSARLQNKASVTAAQSLETP